MFCLILKCEEICGRPAKSHYSPPCSAVLHEASPRMSKKHGRQRKKICILPQKDKRLRSQVQSSWSKLIGYNWLVKYFLMPWPCRSCCSCTLFNRCAPIIWKKWHFVTMLKCGFAQHLSRVLILSCALKVFTDELAAQSTSKLQHTHFFCSVSATVLFDFVFRL